jgi:hypothetical protein
MYFVLMYFVIVEMVSGQVGDIWSDVAPQQTPVNLQV